MSLYFLFVSLINFEAIDELRLTNIFFSKFLRPALKLSFDGRILVDMDIIEQQTQQEAKQCYSCQLNSSSHYYQISIIFRYAIIIIPKLVLSNSPKNFIFLNPNCIIFTPQVLTHISLLQLNTDFVYIQLKGSKKIWNIYSYNNDNNITNFKMTKQMRPLQLISFDANKRLQVTPQASAWLSSVSQEHHIGVITVVGKYRTGKSYILNRVLLNQNKGFEVGPTINACTKGLWVWPELIENQNDPGTRYMVMDTEGLGSLEEGEQTDTKIFLMAMLLSSFFIYNSVGSIDQKAIQNLSLIINLSKLLQKGDERDRQTIVECFPSLLWLVRDFALRLVDDKGFPISPQEYLQNALRAQKGTSDLAVRKNNIRKELTTFFRDRDCFTLIRPVDDQLKLQDMSKLKDSELRPKFLQLINELKKKIFYQAKRKTFKGKPCSPAMFIELCQHFCQAINNGGLPEIQSNWDMICKSQSARIQKRCTTEFEQLLKTYSDKDIKTLNAKQMEMELEQKINDLLKYFDKNALGDKSDKKKEMREKMKQKVEDIKKKMSREKNKQMEQKFQDISEKLQQKINSNSIESIFDISEEYDKLIQSNNGNLTAESQAFVYSRAYEGFKSAAFNFFGNSKQSQTHHNNLLTEKLNLYQTSLNRIQSETTKRTEQADKRERQLRQSIYELEMKAQKAIQELERAKRQLNLLQQRKGVQNMQVVN